RRGAEHLLPWLWRRAHRPRLVRSDRVEPHGRRALSRMWRGLRRRLRCGAWALGRPASGHQGASLHGVLTGAECLRAARAALNECAQLAAQALAASARKQPIDLCVAAAPDRHCAGEQRATGSREPQPTTAPIVGIDTDGDQAAAVQRLERGSKRRAIGAKYGSDGNDAGRGGLVERNQQRELPPREAERPQRLIKAPREYPRGALQMKAQTGVPDEQRCFEWNFGCL